jgi:hypothetical protein
MKIKDIYESTTSGSIATVAAPMGKVQKRAGSLFKGKKTNKPFYEDEVNEADLILVPGHGQKVKPGFIAKDKDRTDHEVEMARSDLYQAAQNAKKVYELIQGVSEEQGLEGWVQEKIIKANDYLNTIREYLEHKTYMQETTGGVLAGGMSNFEEDVTEGQGFDVVDTYKGWKFETETQEEDDRYVTFYGAVSPDGKWHSLPKRATKEQFRQFVDSKAGVAENKCPECGGPAFSEESIAEAKDACYHKVKSRYKVWPSAYASGALVKCRKVGASNWGNKSKK